MLKEKVLSIALGKDGVLRKVMNLPKHDVLQPLLPPGIDPHKIGYDGQFYHVDAHMTEAKDLLDYSSGNTDSISINDNMVITSILLVANPYRHDVTTATITVVQDAVDKLLSGLAITGEKGTYFQLSDSTLYLKALGQLNKHVYGGALTREDLATGVGADNDSYQAWFINFGVEDHDRYDIRAGIPTLGIHGDGNVRINGTFGTSQIIAVTAANGTIDANTDVYAIIYGVTGLTDQYIASMPRPEFTHDHKLSPLSTTEFELLGGRFLKRSTFINLGVAASNNEPRNDSNITSISIVETTPKRFSFADEISWQNFKAHSLLGSRMVIDKDGAAAIEDGGLTGVAVIDWREITGNPFGLDLTNEKSGDTIISFKMGTLTGSIHAYHEYYAPPDVSVYSLQPPFRNQ